MKILLRYVFFIFFFFSCENENAFRKEYHNLKNSVIVLPDSMDRHKNHGYKILIYKDSLSCTPCYLKTLDTWNAFLKTFKRNPIEVLFIFEPKNADAASLPILLKKRMAHHKYWIDTTGMFRRSNNQITSDDNLHCLLLDENNKVVIIGDPLRNEKIRHLITNKIYSQK